MKEKDQNIIDYAKLIDDAMHFVVKSALKQVEREGLPPTHHFFITFKTDTKGVMMGDKLKERYPEEMTIVIQHQFYDLEVTEENFSIVLSFDGIKHNLTVPFASLISFVDPSVKFGLQFSQIFSEDEHEEAEVEEITPSKKKKGTSAKGKETKSKKGENNVITLDKFRKKEDKK